MDILHLRIGECEPYLLHLVGSEEAVDDLDTRAQKRHIGEVLLQGLLCSRVDAGPLDVDTNEVDIGIDACKADGVFAFSAAQLKNYGVGVVEVFLAPVAFHVERHFADD